MNTESKDELMDELTETPFPYEVFFQFGEGEPIRFARASVGDFSLTLKCVNSDDPSVEFFDGKGNSFKIFIKGPHNGI